MSQKKSKDASSPSTLTYSKLMELMIQAFYSSRDIDIVIQELLKAVVDGTHMDRAYIFEKLNQDDLLLTRTYRYNLVEPAADLNPYVTIPIAKIDWWEDSLQGIPRFVSDTAENPTNNENDIRPDDVRSYVQFPIIVEGTLAGLVGIANCHKPHHWTEDEQRIYQDLSSFLSELISRKKMERQISHANTVMTMLLDSLEAFVYVVNYESHELLFANKQLRDFCGERYALGKMYRQVIPPDLSCACFPLHKATIRDASREGPASDLYVTSIKKWFDVSGTLIDWIDGQKAVLMMHNDITARKEIEQELMHTNAIHNFALVNAKSFSWEIDANAKTIWPSSAATQSLGYPLDEITGSLETYFKKLKCPDAQSIRKQLEDYKSGKSNVFSLEHQLTTANGQIKWVLAKGKFLDREKGTICGVSIDITEQKAYEQRLTERVYRDSLTGAYNLQYLIDNPLPFSISDGHTVGAMVLDVRSFKNINETFGHDYGDRILVGVVDRLSGLITDELILRISGDRFLIVCENTNKTKIENLAKLILKSFKTPILIDTQSIKLDFKIGIARSTSHHHDITDLLKDAEIALYDAKKSDLRDYQMLTDTLRTTFGNKVNMELELQKAIKQKDFIMYYQPKVDIRTNQITGTEALIRWNHADHGVISPLDFVSLAEETGQIIQIGDLVIEEVTRQLRVWLDKGWRFFISLNVSAKQFLSPDLTGTIKKWLEFYRVPPEYLGIEITETIMISDFSHVNEVLNELRDYGVKILLDDFGTGYSSMNYLSKVPIDNIKVDKAFLDNTGTDKKELSILKSIIVLSHALNLMVTVEGVETEDQVATLKQFGCDFIQGYFYSKPLPPNEFETFFLNWNS